LLLEKLRVKYKIKNKEKPMNEIRARPKLKPKLKPKPNPNTPTALACQGCGKKPPYRHAKANKTMALRINIIKFSNIDD
jgi:hypothetical protein